MGPVAINERFVAACSPVVSSNYDTCGTVTRATIAHLNSSQLATLFTSGGLFADLDAWFKHSIEMKACGVRRYALYDWIMANTDRTLYRAAASPGIKAVKSPSLVQPFIFGRQESVVNRDHFKITNSWTTTEYNALGNDTDDYPLSDAELALATNPAGLTKRVMRIETRYSIPMDPNFFRSKESIHVFTRAANGQSEHGQWTVLASASDTALSFCDVVVFDTNGGSTEPYSTAPTSGIIIPGVNNVSDYERWCQNLPTLDPRKRVPFWVQTYRTARCIDSEYRAVFARLMESNAAFREFGDLPLAERNKQDELEMEKRFINDFFYNKPIGANQTTVLWESLEAIYTVAGAVIDPGLSGKLVGRRANFIGVREQLRVCDRLFDLGNQPLNFLEWLDLNYDIKRARESQGRKVTDIDWWTDSSYRATLWTAFMTYYKDKLLDQFRITATPNQINKALDVSFDSFYCLRPSGVRINILSDEYFDDFLDQFDNINIASRGRQLLCLDIGKPGAGSIYWAQIAANRKVYTTAQIEQLAKLDTTYRCVMENPTLEQTLLSQTGTVVVECPLNSAWIENIASTTPTTSGQVANPNYTNLY